MPIPICCPGCLAEYQLADHLGGQRVVCRHCQRAFDVPAPVADETRFSAVPAACAPATCLADSVPAQPRGVRVARTTRLLGWLWTPVPLGYVLALLLALVCLGIGLAHVRVKPRPVVECDFAGKATVGDLQIAIKAVRTRTVSGQRGGRIVFPDMTYALVTVTNLSATRTVEWPCWQGTGTIQDEEGNKFGPADVTGWSPVPDDGLGNDLVGVPTNTRTQIAPGETYRSAVYFQPAPQTSKRALLTFNLDGTSIRFREPLEHGTLVICILPPPPDR